MDSGMSNGSCVSRNICRDILLMRCRRSSSANNMGIIKAMLGTATNKTTVRKISASAVSHRKLTMESIPTAIVRAISTGVY